MLKLSIFLCLFISVVASSAQPEIQEILTDEEYSADELSAVEISEADILQSLDEVVNQLDSEISIIQAKDYTPTQQDTIANKNNDIADTPINITDLIEEDELESSFLLTEDGGLDNKTYEDQMDLFDSFDDMDFNDSIYENDLDNGQIVNPLMNKASSNMPPPTTIKVLSDNLNTTFDNSYGQDKTISSQGVGIMGEDEKTINNLDNSDLMDYIDNTDDWSEYIADDDIEIEFHD